MLSTNTEITKISRVGEATARKLKKLGIATVKDLLFHFPWRYDDFSRVVPINKLVSGVSANVVGTIELIQNRRSRRRRMYLTEALINDGSETLKAIWFNQPFIARNLRPGDRISLAGKVDENYGSLAMVSPVYEKITAARAVHTRGLIPNYHLTADITQKQLRFLINQVVKSADSLVDWLPEEIKKRRRLPSLAAAINKIHFPKNMAEVEVARQRLAFNELFLLQLQSQLIKLNLKASWAATINFFEKETRQLVERLPFKLTNAQRKSAWEILRDLEKDSPMSRLLEGDVGSGKTMVAAIALLNTALNKKQAVFMVPTEILAKQHYNNLAKLLVGFNIKIGLITRSGKNITHNMEHVTLNKSKKQPETQIIAQQSDIIVGTHALIQEKIEFRDLALAVIDEQHRFGVDQRKTLVEKSGNKNTTPHLLSLTATPIPRSLALALYGDLDISIINQLPAGRKKIITRIVPEDKRGAAYRFIRQQIDSGRQVFVICPLIDFSDKLGVKSVKEEFDRLDKNVFPDLSIGMLHGRLKPGEKEKIMQDFLSDKIKILVATSVVEVGVDVPNASIMMIEGAERFGLAQLHQFRGRVGRSQYQSYCFLFSEAQNERSLKRLETLVAHNDGFTLAKMDLKFRGPGEIYGLEQSGFPELKIASLFDYQLMKQAKEEAVGLLGKDEQLKNFPLLKEELNKKETESHLE